MFSFLSYLGMEFHVACFDLTFHFFQIASFKKDLGPLYPWPIVLRTVLLKEASLLPSPRANYISCSVVRWWFLLLWMWFRYNHLESTMSTLFICSVQLVWRMWVCGFKISSSKSPAILFTRKHDPAPISLILRDGTRQQMKNEYKYFKLTFQRNGTYSKHVQNVAVKCRARLNVIRMLKCTSWGAGKRSLLTVCRSLVRSVIEYGSEAYFFTSPNLLKPLHKIQNDVLRLCTGAMASTPLICLHHACDEMPLLIRHMFLCLTFKAHLLSFSDHPAQWWIEDCWQERFANSPSFSCCTMFTKVAVDHSLLAAAPLRNPNIPPRSLQQPLVDFALFRFVHQTTSAFVAPYFWSHLHNTYDQCVEIYADGSKTSSRAGCGMYIAEKNKIFDCNKQVFLLHHLRTLRLSPRIVPCFLIKNCQGRYCHRQS